MPADPVMTTPRRAALSLPLVALLAPCNVAPAGPPEGVSGRMVFDNVADGLRRYRRDTDPERRIGRLKKLAPTRDPRVGIVLGEYITEAPINDCWVAAGELLERYYLPRPVKKPTR